MDDGVAGVGGAGNSFYFLWQEAAEQRDELLAACEKALEFILYADFDFRNGNVSQGIDEGEHYGWQATSTLKKRLETTITKVKGKE